MNRHYYAMGLGLLMVLAGGWLAGGVHGLSSALIVFGAWILIIAAITSA